MFELALGKAGTVLETTRMLARDVYRAVRKEEREQFAERASQETEEAKKDMETGIVDDVDAHVLASLTDIQKGELVDIRIERKTMMFMYRVLKEYRDEEDQFEKLRLKLNQLFSGQDQKDTESRKYLEQIIRFFQTEQEEIHAEVLRFAHIMKDQDFQNLRLRDEIVLGVMKDIREKQKARRLRVDFRNEHREEKAIVRDLNSIHSSLRQENPDKKKVEAALENVAKHLGKENNALHQMMDNIEFILKMAVMLIFKIMKAENEEEALIAHLKELKYPDSHWQLLNKKKEGVGKSIVDDLRRVMHEMYQLLHTDMSSVKTGLK